jgi:hypothetical protein
MYMLSIDVRKKSGTYPDLKPEKSYQAEFFEDICLKSRTVVPKSDSNGTSRIVEKKFDPWLA